MCGMKNKDPEVSLENHFNRLGQGAPSVLS